MIRFPIQCFAISISIGAIIQGCQPVSHKPQIEPIKGFEVPADRPAITDSDRIRNNTIRPDEVERIEQRRVK
ncbi:MAG: hypothetical protein J0L70_18265 [Leptolyngbya sp. UWPOB_LEPTO1]|uniref:hypothetical protein n=1 Tax=Leptolyngbya sp. UWPOB_LEPTO1 TaxID=2815653 RepID=UPI001AC1027E|nr:hypothetical protein [Leptolyngbya sp. UWPOB_LEPTO1]MBN8562480.1 hypothetical protein [Leptolyngbya sp. UWPOB_LEPTO1]